MPGPFTITSATLQSEYTRLNDNWLARNGLDYFKIVFYHRRRRTLLVGLQRPPLRDGKDVNNFIVSIDGVDAFVGYEQRGKDRQKQHELNGDDIKETTQIHVFLVAEEFRFAMNPYPTQNQILAGGRTETIQNLQKIIRGLGSSLFRRDSKTGPIFFMDENFQPVTRVGEDPDEGFRPRDHFRNRVNRSDRQVISSKTPVEARIRQDDQEYILMIYNKDANEVLETMEEIFPDTSLEPF